MCFRWKFCALQQLTEAIKLSRVSHRKSVASMSIKELVFVLGISAAYAGQAIGNIYVSEELLKYDEAVTACREDGTKLARPLSEAHNDRTQEALDNQLSQALIGLQVFPSGWHVHNTEIMLLNQGCYNRSSLMFTHHGAYSTINGCTEYCSGSSEQYAAFQRKNDNTEACICSSSVLLSAALPDNKCRASCGDSEVKFCGSEHDASYRVLAINANNNFPPWDTETPPWHNLQCASYYWREQDTIFQHYLQPKYCLEHHPSLCLTPNITSIIKENSTWFEAHKKCFDTGGHLFVPNSNLSTMPTWPKNTPHWTGVTGWMFRESTGSRTGYSNWAGGQPDLTRGNCVIMNSRGYWESSRCDVDLHYICESENASHATSSSTTPTSTRSHAMTTPELTSAIPSSNSSTRYVSYSTKGKDVMMSSSNEAPATSSTTNTDGISGLSAASMGVAIGLPIATIVIIILTVTSVLIYRKRHLNKDGVKHQSTPDGSTKETTAVDLDYYALRGINGVTNNDDSPSPNVAPDQDREGGVGDDEEPPVYGTPDKGRTDEGVLIVDNELYGDSQLDEQRPEQNEIGQSAPSPVSNKNPNTLMNLQQLSSEESSALYEFAEPVQADHLYSN